MSIQTSGKLTQTIIVSQINNSHYQIYFKNIYGYLSTLLIDRCKKIGLYYNWISKNYLIKSQTLSTLYRELQIIKSLKINGESIDFVLIKVPSLDIKRFLSIKSNNLNDQKKINKRYLLLDKNFQMRFNLIVNEIKRKKIGNKDANKTSMLLICFAINNKKWRSQVFNQKQFQVNQIGVEQIKRQLFHKKQTKQFQTNQAKANAFILNYENLKYACQNLPFLKSFFQSFSSILIDDSEILRESDTSFNFGDQYSNYVKSILQHHSTQKELIFIYGRLPEIKDLVKMLVILQPKSYGGLKFSQINNKFSESNLNKQQKLILKQSQSFLKKRYRIQAKTNQQMIFLLNQTVFVNLSNRLSQNYVITQTQILVQLKSEVIQKFRVMDKKYKKYNQLVNLKQIIQNIHQNKEGPKFQIVSEYSTHVIKKQSNNYLFQARQLILKEKINQIFHYLAYFSNLRLRLTLIVQDQGVLAKIKRFLHENQICFTQYTMRSFCKEEIVGFRQYQQKQLGYQEFNTSNKTNICIISRSKILKQYIQLESIKQNKKRSVRLGGMQQFGNKQYIQSQGLEQNILPKITTSDFVLEIDSFWFPFHQTKERLIQQIFDYHLQYYTNDQLQQELTKYIGQINKKYFICKNSFQKILIQKYRDRLQGLFNQNVEQKTITQRVKQNQINNYSQKLIKKQSQYYKQCEHISYLDIDQQYDKIESIVRKQKNKKINQVFLPKFTENKSFKQIMQEKQQKISQKLMFPMFAQQIKMQNDFEIKQTNVKLQIYQTNEYNSDDAENRQIKIQQAQVSSQKNEQKAFLAKRSNLKPQFFSSSDQSLLLKSNQENEQKLQIKYQNLSNKGQKGKQNQPTSKTAQSNQALRKMNNYDWDKIKQNEQAQSQLQHQYLKVKLQETIKINQLQKILQKQKQMSYQEVIENVKQQQKYFLQDVQKQKYKKMQDYAKDEQNNEIQTDQSQNYLKQYDQVLDINNNKKTVSFFKSQIMPLETSKQKLSNSQYYLLNDINKNFCKTYHQIPLHPNKSDTSIQIIQTEQQTLSQQQTKNQSRKNKQKKSIKTFQNKNNKRLVFQFNEQVQDLDQIQVKNMKPRQIYQKAVNKSKRLWEKKIKKNRQKIICKQKKLQIDLFSNRSIAGNQKIKLQILSKLNKVHKQIKESLTDK